MRTYRNKYTSEIAARKAVKAAIGRLGSARIISSTDEKNAVVILRHDRFQGVVTVRYEW